MKHRLNLDPNVDNADAWQAMDAYFSALYDHAKTLNPNLRVLIPPMTQDLWAEQYAFGTCTEREVLGGGSGYDWMRQTYSCCAHAAPETGHSDAHPAANGLSLISTQR